MRDLTVQVGQLNRVTIDNTEGSYAGASQVRSRGTPEAASTYDEHLGGS